MKLNIDTHARDLLLDRATIARFTESRRENVHASDLIYCLRRAFHEKLGEEIEGDEKTKSNLTMMLGEAFQAWLLPGVDDAEHRLIYEGIIATPDGIVTLANGERVPLEIKSTRTSSNKVPGHSYARGATLNHYVDQVATYCLALGTRSARIAVLYMSGDYGANRDATLVVYAVEFSAAELERWARIISHRKDQLVSAMQTGIPPSIDEHLPWTCGYCPYHEKLCPGSPGKWGQNFSVDTEPWGEEGAQ